MALMSPTCISPSSLYMIFFVILIVLLYSYVFAR
jgi:hypothetical protein